MTRVLRYAAAAIAEAEDIASWYGERSPQAREAFLQELRQAFDSISEAPARWPRYLHGTRRIVLKRFPFSVVYRETGGSLEVLAVAHHRRRPGYWRER